MPNFYMQKYVGKYRVLCELDLETNDVYRDKYGNVDEDCELYIDCQYGNKIKEWGHDTNGRMLLKAYIPSLTRGRNIKKSLDKTGIPYTVYDEYDGEVEFRFSAKYIDEYASLLKAKTGGASISPFSVKNLPKANVSIPSAEIERYKSITAEVNKDELLIIHKITTAFLASVLQRKYKAFDKNYNYRVDMRKMKMGRMAKEFIWAKGLFDEYLAYLKKEIDKFYKKKRGE